MNPIDFRTGSYFSGNLTFGGIALLLCGIVVGSINLLTGIFLTIVSAVILSTHYRIRIDTTKKNYFDYVWILGFKSGTKRSFDRLEYIYIKKSRISQTMHARVASTTVQKDSYDAYVRFSETHKVHLCSRDDKKQLISKVRPICSALDTQLIDYTTGDKAELIL